MKVALWLRWMVMGEGVEGVAVTLATVAALEGGSGVVGDEAVCC